MEDSNASANPNFRLMGDLEHLVHELAHVVVCTGKAKPMRSLDVHSLIVATCPTSIRQDNNEVMTAACTVVVMMKVQSMMNGDRDWVEFCRTRMCMAIASTREGPLRMMRRMLNQKATRRRADIIIQYLNEANIIDGLIAADGSL